MAKLRIKSDETGSTENQSLYLFIQDTSATDGSGLTGLAFNTAGLTAYEVRPLGVATSITLVTLASPTAAYSSGGFVEVDATNMPGVYRFDVPDSVIATGVRSAVVMLRGATNMAPVVLELQLDELADPQVVPPANANVDEKISWLYALARNRITQTSTTQTLYQDDGTSTAATSATSDNAGTFERAEWQ